MSAFKLFSSIKNYLQYRKRFERIPGFMDFYNKQNQELAVVSVRMLCTLGVILYSAVGIMDYALYPENFAVFAAFRILFATVTGSSLILTFTPWGRRHALHLIFVSALLGELLVSYMISLLSGWSSLYFVGNILVTVALTMFIPWRPRVNLIYCALSLAGYIFLVRINHPFTAEMIIPVTFIAVNGLNSYFSSLNSELGRMSQWASLLEIERSHEELKKLNATKERFFSNISHELRTPLTLVIGPLGALARRGGGWVSQELVASMVSNAQRLLRQVNSLLDLSKIDSDEMKCNLEVGNLKELILDLHRASAPGAYERGIKLEFQTPNEIPNSKFDFEKIETILANLISNAIKFTPPRGHILLSCEILDNGFVRLGVSDTGQGIPLEEQDKVFERFHQVEGSAVEAAKGTGLGLSVAKEFAELHGGRIWFESKVGEGTQFWVDIPFLKTTEPLANTQENEVSVRVRADMRSTLLSDVVRHEGLEILEGSINDGNHRRMKERNKDKRVILYVDDSADLRQYVESILSSYYTVILAADGEQGFTEAMTYTPDLILSDVMMPKLDGFGFCQKIRAESKLKATPFILLTANSSLDSRIEGLDTGADDHLSKPFSERELVARIRNLLALRETTLELKKQMDAAKKLQLMLLPPLSQSIQGVKIEAIYKASEDLSGDFFDTIPVGKWIYVYLAEVGGRGIPAAQVTYLVREIFRQALVQELELPVLLDLVRRGYAERYLEYSLSLQLMRINSLTGEVEYLRTGAANPVLVNDRCEIDEVNAPQAEVISPMASASKSKGAEMARFRIAANAKMYCYSDGAYKFKLENNHEFGPHRLMKSFAGTHILEWPEGLIQTLKTENHHEAFSDDMTILRVSLKDQNAGLSKTETPRSSSSGI